MVRLGSSTPRTLTDSRSSSVARYPRSPTSRSRNSASIRHRTTPSANCAACRRPLREWDASSRSPRQSLGRRRQPRHRPEPECRSDGRPGDDAVAAAARRKNVMSSNATTDRCGRARSRRLRRHDSRVTETESGQHISICARVDRHGLIAAECRSLTGGSPDADGIDRPATRSIWSAGPRMYKRASGSSPAPRRSATWSLRCPPRSSMRRRSASTCTIRRIVSATRPSRWPRCWPTSSPTDRT